ncbi:glycoside hydrolase family 32 protein [Janthinobacterium psychrotolerans]|uniref:Glycosyl hydrolases family 32 C terminal n=1 Tax=Janthinobacterium psychrotolerans TaxID=1747903 RepID=A0A1A7C6A4_9BURK|nr:glycoside hydrolase family 32 protein [Janthinobacterium psychrotolerans]OBV39843.1 Glycosyl hydrolases family 32 C terminal [Janthinobacterium psychrotolerans]
MSKHLPILASCLATLLVGCSSGNDNTSEPAQSGYLETYRPQLSYTAAKNWLNDPNGLVYHDGEYHLFYQYNPNGNTWGDMSWGHAVSTDLLHWNELPVALTAEKDAGGKLTQMFFSGSVVVDTNNTSGLGSAGNPAMVAIYTSVYPQGKALANGQVLAPNAQAQSIAYSLDRGRTWKQYAANPVIPVPPAPFESEGQNFRDPKVFWYAPEQKWVMVAVASERHQALLFSSKNLRDWTYMSAFGPANAVGGIWECPDLFELPVDGDASKRKWVMNININPGSVAGGSGAHYFVGKFDGKQFVADANSVIDKKPPAGTVYQDFEAASFDATGWASTGDFAGKTPVAPAHGVADNQGSELLDTYRLGKDDAATGTLTSPAFTVTSKYINLMVGGGRHPRVPEAGDGTVPAGTLLFPGAGFEGPANATYADLGWTPTGDVVGQKVAAGSDADRQAAAGKLGAGVFNSLIGAGDVAKGSLTSPTFTISRAYINFLIGGGNHPYSSPNPTAVVLKVNGKVVRSANGADSELNWTNWDVREFAGQQAQIVIIDDNDGAWGHIVADVFEASDQPAKPVSHETTVNLLVNGQVVKSETGANAEALNWRNWNVDAYRGKSAQIQVVDKNTGGWGHILVDHIVFSDTAKEEANWLDYGADFYAAVTWNGIPDGKRIGLGWMSNWDYAGNTPTTPWRSAQTFAREFTLRTIGGQVRLVQQPVDNFSTLRDKALYSVQDRSLAAGVQKLDIAPAPGQALDIVAKIQPGSATGFGLKVRTGANGEETVIGYDAVAGAVYIDRSKSGDASFNASFAARHTAPLPLRTGTVELRIVVDTSSVMVFAGNEVVLTDQIFPQPSSTGVALFTVGGAATLKELTIWPLKSIWAKR